MSLQARLALVVSLVAALTLTLAAAGSYAAATHVFHQMAQEWAADSARELAGSSDFLERVSRRSSLKPARVDRFAQTCYRIVSVARGFDDPETGEAGWAFPLKEEGLRALRDGQPWSEIVLVQGEPVVVYNLPVAVNARVVGVAQVVQDIGDQARALHALGHSLAAGSGLLALFAVTVAWRVSGAALRPLSRMAQSLRSLHWSRAAGRRVELPARAPAEVAALGASLNHMLSSLESALGEMERRLALQQQFVADTSHELRTPLATIRGNLSLLGRADAFSPAEREAILRDAIEESERMARLLDDLLRLSSAGAGRALRRESFDAGAVAETACRRIRLLAADRVVSLHAAGAPALGDPEALLQALLILLDNAVKYTLAGGHISVSVAVHDGQVQVRVADDGVGIDAAHLPRVFDRHYRADRSRPGAGLGLSIARDLIEQQGGAISVSSRRGAGSVFTIALPAAPPSVAQPSL